LQICDERSVKTVLHQAVKFCIGGQIGQRSKSVCVPMETMKWKKRKERKVVEWCMVTYI